MIFRYIFIYSSADKKVSYSFFAALYFDGKHDKTLVKSKAGGNTDEDEDHISVVLHHPDRAEAKQGEYAGFFKPLGGKGNVKYRVSSL